MPADTFLDSIQERLNEEEVKKLQEPFSLTEIWAAVDSSEDNKASGIDGLPAELYRKLWLKIKLSLQAVLNELREASALPKSITLIPKSGDKSMITNWRPISLLCSDYKIFSKCLTQRMKPIKMRVVNPNQTGVMSGHTINDNLTGCRNVVLDSCVHGEAKR